MDQYKPLKSNHLKDIRRREQQATPGPWVANEDVVDSFTIDRVITTQWLNEKTRYPEPVVSISQSENRATLWIQDRDVNFIVSAREDVPQLLSALENYGHRVIYDALLSYMNNRETTESEQTILEHAMETCWQIIKSKSKS